MSHTPLVAEAEAERQRQRSRGREAEAEAERQRQRQGMCGFKHSLLYRVFSRTPRAKQRNSFLKKKKKKETKQRNKVLCAS